MMVPQSRNYPTLAAHELTPSDLACRDAERSALLDRLPSLQGKILDLQAAGGFLADEVHRRFGAAVTCICVEPSAPHRARIASHHQVLADELDNMCSLRSSSVDGVLGLAGFHHSSSIPRTLEECARVLKHGGLFSVCDVERDSKEQDWLDVVVSRYAGSGHQGNYLREKECLRLLEPLGFVQAQEQRRIVPWVFPTEEHLGQFIDGFFNMNIGSSRATALVQQHLGIDTHARGLSIPWTLLYWTAEKHAEPSRDD